MTRKSMQPHLDDIGSFRVAFSTKDDGNMLRTNETRVAVHQNRIRFIKNQGFDLERVFTIRTSHSPNADVVHVEPCAYVRRTYIQAPVIEADFDHYYTGADGALTFDENVAIGLMSGDCVPLIIWDNVSGLHGILHVGLLGALNAMVRVLPRIYVSTGVNIENTRYYLGPSITQRNYNVSHSGLWKVIAPQAHAKVPAIGRYLKQTGEGEHFDVQALITDQLVSLGVDKHQIQRYPFCVAEPESLYFSHNVLKKDGQRGNFFSIIGCRG